MMIVTACSLALLALVGAAFAGGIVQDGNPCAAIVLPADAPSALRGIAKEMQQLIDEGSRAKLEIQETRPSDLIGIHIGRSAYVDSLELDLGSLDEAETRMAFNAKRKQLQLVQYAEDPVLIHPITMESKGREKYLRGDGWGATDLEKVKDWIDRSERVRQRIKKILANPDYDYMLADFRTTKSE